MIKFGVVAAVGLVLISSSAALAEQRTVTLTVDNMYCEACPYMVKKTVERVSGVSRATVSFKEKTATVVFDDSRARIEDLTNATTSAGFPSVPKR